MNINAGLTASRSFSMQTLWGGISGEGQNAGGDPKTAGGPSEASIELLFLSKTQLTLQLQAPQKGEKTALQAPMPGAGLAGGGYWGVEKTAGRIAGFVLQGAGDDAEKLRTGREAILRGFREAEKVWGGKLPDISYKTIDAAVTAIDDRLRQLEAPVVDVVV